MRITASTFRPSTLRRWTFACVFCAGSALAETGIIYQQNFSGSEALSNVNWSALAVRELTGTNVDVSEYTGQVGLNNYGYFAPHLGSGAAADDFNLRVAPGLFYTAAAEIQIDITSLEEVGFDCIGDPTNASFRVVLKVAGQWVAQAVATVDSRDNPGAGGGFLSVVFAPENFAAATNWVTVSNAVAGADAMTLGPAPGSDLSGSIEAIGLYLEHASDHLRFDAFRVSGPIGNLHDDPIVDAMLRVKKFQEWSPLAFNWLSGTFYSGVAACYEATGEQAFLDAARDWCASGNWEISTGVPLNADAICTAQTFLDVYFNDQDTNQIQQINGIFETYYFGQDTIDRDLLGHATWTNDTAPFIGRNLWWWCDALYMAPPLMARLGAATGDDRYYDLLHELYWDTVDFLYSPAEQLFYRDENQFSRTTPLGQPVFWSRGNGWVIGGLVRTIDYLPQDDPMRADYIALFQSMMGRIVTLQGEDGLWRSSLNEPTWYPMKESSGSSFFCFGLAAGINRGWLDRETYHPHMTRAWEGLLDILSPAGKVQWSQDVAAAPGTVEQEGTRSYTQGAFLLAASEVYKAERSLGNMIYTQNFENPGNITNLSSVGWSALGNADTSNANVDASAFSGTIGIAGGDYGFFAPHLGALDNDALLVYTTQASVHVDVASITRVGYSYSGDPTGAVYRVAVQVDGVWYAQADGTADPRVNPGLGGFLSTEFAPPDFAAATNWVAVSNAAVGADPMALGAPPVSDLAGTVTAIGLFLDATLTEDHLRFDGFSVALRAAAPGYAAWAEGFGLFAASLTNDLEPDGLDNLTEYALGGNPTNADAASVLPLFQPLENYFHYIHNERTDDTSLTYTVELTTNLVSNGWNTNGVDWVGEAAFSNVWKTVTNQIPTLGKEQQFIRLKIEKD